VEESIEALASPSMSLDVERYAKKAAGLAAVLEYRASLGELGLTTVDSVRVSETSFECYIHEYGIESAQHGVPRMHAGLKLGFSPEGREMLITSMSLDVEFTPPVNRRSSTFANKDVAVTLQGEL
jgi:hypothetical protein